MASSPGPNPRSWWDKREAERRLAAALGSAREAYRLADIHRRELWQKIWMGMVPPDSNLAAKQANTEIDQALALYSRALENWKNFVIHGIVPPPGDENEHQ